MDTKKKDQSAEEQQPAQNEDQGQGSAWEQNPQEQQPETGSLGGEATYEEDSGEEFYSDVEESDVEAGNEPQQNQTQGGSAGSLKENYDMD